MLDSASLCKRAVHVETFVLVVICAQEIFSVLSLINSVENEPPRRNPEGLQMLLPNLATQLPYITGGIAHLQGKTAVLAFYRHSHEKEPGPIVSIIS